MDLKLGEGEFRLMEIIWESEPVGSTDLVKICGQKYDWKKSTVYTMLKRLGEKGIINNENAVVTSMVNREKVVRQESEDLLNKSFKGSVTDFFAAFLQDRKITEQEAKRLEEMIKEATK